MEQESKKVALIRILQILSKHSDENHLLTQNDIAKYLDKEYSMTIDRKAISRNINILKEAGYEIESSKKGTYLSRREFEDSELHLLIDGILSSKYIAQHFSKQIIDKLCDLSSEHFKAHLDNVTPVRNWIKTDNQSTFYNVEVVDDAIEKKKQIIFEYNRYGVDKKLHKTKDHQVTPIQLFLSNQRYYLLGYDSSEKSVFYYKVDHITNIKLSKEKAAKKEDIKYVIDDDFFEAIAVTPYLFSDKPVKVELIAKKTIVDQVIDWFGKNVSIKEYTADSIKVELKASAMAMSYWALQYIDYVEVVKPDSLRQKIKNKLLIANDKYK